MKELNEGETLEKAALKSAMSENTARRYREGAPRKGARPTRTYRTRTDPFKAVWPEVEAMLEAAPGLEAKTVFERLQQRPEASFTEGQLRTLQRNIRRWRAVRGPQKEVMFPQQHRPGEYGQSDFTSMNDLGIAMGDGDGVLLGVVRVAHCRLSTGGGGAGTSAAEASDRQPLGSDPRSEGRTAGIQRTLPRGHGALRSGGGSEHAGARPRERLGRAGPSPLQARRR